MSILDSFVNSHTLSLAAVAAFGLTVFGVDVVDSELQQIALGLGLLAAAKVVEDE